MMLTAFCRTDPLPRDIIVVDLGHSARETTGILLPQATAGINVSFGEAVRAFSAEINSSSRPPLLIVEAVLSCAYDALGNPAHRGRFERQRTWWISAGAIVALAAQRLVSQIMLRVSLSRHF